MGTFRDTEQHSHSFSFPKDHCHYLSHSRVKGSYIPFARESSGIHGSEGILGSCLYSPVYAYSLRVYSNELRRRRGVTTTKPRCTSYCFIAGQLSRTNRVNSGDSVERFDGETRRNMIDALQLGHVHCNQLSRNSSPRADVCSPPHRGGLRATTESSDRASIMRRRVFYSFISCRRFAVLFLTRVMPSARLVVHYSSVINSATGWR